MLLADLVAGDYVLSGVSDDPTRRGHAAVSALVVASFAIPHGNLITGQQDFSGAATAELLGQLGR